MSSRCPLYHYNTQKPLWRKYKTTQRPGGGGGGYASVSRNAGHENVLVLEPSGGHVGVCREAILYPGGTQTATTNHVSSWFNKQLYWNHLKNSSRIIETSQRSQQASLSMYKSCLTSSRTGCARGTQGVFNAPLLCTSFNHSLQPQTPTCSMESVMPSGRAHNPLFQQICPI